jgi:hypothetical protein
MASTISEEKARTRAYELWLEGSKIMPIYFVGRDR